MGHGRRPVWNRVFRYLSDELHLSTEDWESQSRTGFTAPEALKEIGDRTTFAVIVVTAEDLTADDQARARQNVIHEIGYFQHAVGFRRVAILVEEGVDELRRTLVREGVLTE